jgi:signal transduction histidine kinase
MEMENGVIARAVTGWGTLSRSWRRPAVLTSRFRTAAVSVGLIAAAELLALMVVEVVKPTGYWSATLLDTVTTVLLAAPVLWLLIFRPLFALISARRQAVLRLEKQAGDMEALATENAALLQAEQRERQRADTLHVAGLAISRTLDIEEVFKAILQQLGTIVPYDRAKIILREGDARLRVRAIFRSTGALDVPDRPFDSFLPGSNEAIREVLTSQRSVVIADTSVRPGWGDGGHGPIERSWLGVPLRAGAKDLGLCTLVKAEPNYFTPERIRVVEAIAAPAAVAVAHARLFDEVCTGRERLQALSRELVDGQERERRRVARELHDEAGQLLSTLVFGLRRLERSASNPEEVVALAQELKRVSLEAQEGLHRLASDLRPAALDHLGLVPALGQLAARVHAQGGPEVRMETIGFEDRRLSPEAEIALYRIAQEGLTNALQHSGASRISLVLMHDGARLRMILEDDGRGLDVDLARRSDGLGLLGIKERAEMLGGTLVIEARPGAGTTLVVEAPDAA